MSSPHLVITFLGNNLSSNSKYFAQIRVLRAFEPMPVGLGNNLSWCVKPGYPPGINITAEVACTVFAESSCPALFGSKTKNLKWDVVPGQLVQTTLPTAGDTWHFFV